MTRGGAPIRGMGMGVGPHLQCALSPPASAWPSSGRPPVPAWTTAPPFRFRRPLRRWTPRQPLAPLALPPGTVPQTRHRPWPFPALAMPGGPSPPPAPPPAGSPPPPLLLHSTAGPDPPPRSLRRPLPQPPPVLLVAVVPLQRPPQPSIRRPLRTATTSVRLLLTRTPQPPPATSWYPRPPLTRPLLAPLRPPLNLNHARTSATAPARPVPLT